MSQTAIPNVENRPAIASGVLGMVFLLVTELMFFAGLISAYIVNKAGNTWPPLGQPRLPVEITAVNSLFLLGSAATIYLVWKHFSSNDHTKAQRFLLITFLLGLTFVAIQGFEWVRLVGFGLTTSSSTYGAFFYTIIGVHGAHVVVGLGILAYLRKSLQNIESKYDALVNIKVCSLYWYFVVGIWPLLYVLVYLL